MKVKVHSFCVDEKMRLEMCVDEGDTCNGVILVDPVDGELRHEVAIERGETTDAVCRYVEDEVIPLLYPYLVEAARKMTEALSGVKFEMEV